MAMKYLAHHIFCYIFIIFNLTLIIGEYISGYLLNRGLTLI